MDKGKLKKLKEMGFLDRQLLKKKQLSIRDRQVLKSLSEEESKLRKKRKDAGVSPTYKMVDTCAAEFDAETPYYYSTYEREDEVEVSDRKKVIILGAGPIRIGQGIEFDCCTVHAVFALRKIGIETIIVNSNPETVSTDFDISDKLYFEPITLEDVLNIVDKEKKNLLGVMVQFGGQTSINLVKALEAHGVTILGTQPEDTDRSENRDLFGKILDKLGLLAAPWGTGFSFAEVKEVAEKIGYPVLVRPSYVLGGRAMEIVDNEKELEEYMKEAARVSPEHPILVDKFLDDSVEIDVDGVCDGEDVLIGAVMQHIEEAGVHSGDSACVIPPQTISEEMIEKLKDCTRKLAFELKTVGLINVQYAIKDGEIYTLEVNPRASRTMPFVNKAVGVSLAKLAAKVMVGKKLKDLVKDMDPMDRIKHVAVKEVVFPFIKLPGVDPILSPEMKSTGEVMGIDKDFPMAFYKAEIAANNQLPMDGQVFISVKDKDKKAILPVAEKFSKLGFEIICTPGTSKYLLEHGVSNEVILRIQDGNPNILDMMRNKRVDLIINTPSHKPGVKKEAYMMRRGAIELNVPYITTLPAARATIDAIEKVKNRAMDVKSLNDYFKDI